MVRLHDSLARRAVELTTRVPGRVSMYVCGPTVYDVPHVGHGRTALVYDVIRRYLEWQGNVVTFVGNVTNVEDKIIARAAAEGTSERELADRYEQAYWDELARLNVRRPDEVPRATEFIEPMVELIGELVDTGHAYVSEGEGVYFSVASYARYGDLSVDSNLPDARFALGGPDVNTFTAAVLAMSSSAPRKVMVAPLADAPALRVKVPLPSSPPPVAVRSAPRVHDALL